jgi:hypothetical protein
MPQPKKRHLLKLLQLMRLPPRKSRSQSAVAARSLRLLLSKLRQRLQLKRLHQWQSL